MSPNNFQQPTKEIGGLADPFSPEKKPISEPEKEFRPEVGKEGLKKEAEGEVIAPKEPIKERPAITPPRPFEPTPAKSPALVKIENILEEDLDDTYSRMEPKLRQKFKVDGEKTAVKIEEILKQTKVKAHRIFKLIFAWLKIIPGINKFFLKQEAKIKTDKIIKLK